MGTGSLESEYPLSPEKQVSEEPFECPNCGQLLDFRCRVCVACREAVDPARIPRTPPPEISPAPTETEEDAPKPLVRFPWEFSLLLLLVSAAGVTVLGYLLSPTPAQFVFLAFQVLCAVCVFHDARYFAIPRPLRWSLGTLFLWVVFFPWYLVRRRRLSHACPFVEVSPYFPWVLVFIYLVMFLILKQEIGSGSGPPEIP